MWGVGTGGTEPPASSTLLSRFPYLKLPPPAPLRAAPDPCKLAEWNRHHHHHHHHRHHHHHHHHHHLYLNTVKYIRHYINIKATCYETLLIQINLQ